MRLGERFPSGLPEWEAKTAESITEALAIVAATTQDCLKVNVTAVGGESTMVDVKVSDVQGVIRYHVQHETMHGKDICDPAGNFGLTFYVGAAGEGGQRTLRSGLEVIQLLPEDTDNALTNCIAEQSNDDQS